MVFKSSAAIVQLEKEKIIRGYQAVIDWDKTDRENVTALIEVKVIPQRGDGFDRIAERIYQYDEVESVLFPLIKNQMIFLIFMQNKVSRAAGHAL